MAKTVNRSRYLSLSSMRERSREQLQKGDGGGREGRKTEKSASGTYCKPRRLQVLNAGGILFPRTS